MAHEGFHEDPNQLSDFAKNYHRILQSTIEEFEAVDWYNQRAECATDAEAKAIMEHNRDEEVEHACMGLEWLRKNSPVWDEMMRKFLFQEGDIVANEATLETPDQEDTPLETGSGLNIGNNRK
jgi:uncharacterized protein